MFPELLTIEDGVLLGTGAKVCLHEFGIDQFRAGKVILRRGALVGGMAVIRCGVEIGAGAVVALSAVVTRDVPSGCTAISPRPRSSGANHAPVATRNPTSSPAHCRSLRAVSGASVLAVGGAGAERDGGESQRGLERAQASAVLVDVRTRRSSMPGTSKLPYIGPTPKSRRWPAVMLCRSGCAASGCCCCAKAAF